MTKKQRILNIFAEELKLSAEELIAACDGTGEITPAEAKEAGEMDALMKVYKRIITEVFNG